MLVSETTPFDAALVQLPVVGSLLPQALLTLHRVPILADVLAPLIGQAVTAPVSVDIAAVVPDGAPVARTITVTSFRRYTDQRPLLPGVGAADRPDRAHHLQRRRPGLRR